MDTGPRRPSVRRLLGRLFHQRTQRRLSFLVSVGTMIGTLATVYGVFLTARQLQVATDVDKRQTTAQILAQTRQTDLLQAIRRLVVLRDSGQAAALSLTEQTITDRDLVVNVYDSLAIYYSANTLNPCLVKAHTRSALDVVVAVLRYLDDPPDTYWRITRLRDRLDALTCPES